MAKSAKYTVQFHRQHEGRTNYHKRMKLLSSNKPRLVVRRSNKHIRIQVVEFTQTHDKIVAQANTNELAKHGWKGPNSNLSAAYLVGALAAKKALKSGVKEAIADIGMQTSHPKGVIFAAIKGAVDAGLKVPLSETVAPEEKRLRGEHIAEYAKKLKETPEAYKKQFSYEAEQLPAMFDKTKAAIMEAQ